jgi:hypothetical protein
MGGLVALSLWRERGGHKWLALAFFLWGVGLWDKALLVWPLIGLAVATVCVYPRELWRALRPKPAAIAAVTLLTGALPLVWYNIALHGATAASNTRLSIGSLPQNFGELQLVVRGDVLFDSIVSTTPGPIAREPASLAERVSIAISHYAGSHRTRPLLLALALSVIAWLALLRRPEGRLLVFIALDTAIAWLQMASNAGTGGGAHHVILLWPFPCVFVGIALASASARFPKPAQWAVMALVAWLTFANFLNTNEYLAALIRNGGVTTWTDASERLAGAISHYRSDPIIIVDWGYGKILRMFYGGELNLISIDDGNRMRVDYATMPGAIFIRHTDDRQVFPGVNDRLRAGAAALGYAEDTLRVVHDDEGRAIFEIVRFVKAPQPAR